MHLSTSLKDCVSPSGKQPFDHKPGARFGLHCFLWLFSIYFDKKFSSLESISNHRYLHLFLSSTLLNWEQKKIVVDQSLNGFSPSIAEIQLSLPRTQKSHHLPCAAKQQRGKWGTRIENWGPGTSRWVLSIWLTRARSRSLRGAHDYLFSLNVVWSWLFCSYHRHPSHPMQHVFSFIPIQHTITTNQWKSNVG